MAFSVARLISAALLVCAFGRHRYSHYQLLRLVVCGVTVYGAYYAYTLKIKIWMVVFAIIAALFNPFLPVHLSRDTWNFFDLATAAVLLLSVFLLKSENKGQKNV